ncbi:unnamed protein product, partial [Pocillopora meandrina]
ICKRSFDIGKDKVRDHCNFTGKYCGAAHYKCNRQFKKPKFTPVIFHNLANYDSHLFFNEAELPPEEEFYSKLNNSDISHEDYEYAQKVWKEFKMNTMGDYHDLYLKTDVLLLADEFEEFRNVCVENYKLDPAWYFTASGLA